MSSAHAAWDRCPVPVTRNETCDLLHRRRWVHYVVPGRWPPAGLLLPPQAGGKRIVAIATGGPRPAPAPLMWQVWPPVDRGEAGGSAPLATPDQHPAHLPSGVGHRPGGLIVYRPRRITNSASLIGDLAASGPATVERRRECVDAQPIGYDENSTADGRPSSAPGRPPAVTGLPGPSIHVQITN